jgi:hypothetical protein
VTAKIDVAQPSSYTSSEGNAPQLVTKLPQKHCTQHERSKLDYILRMSNGHNKAEVSAVMEMVFENNVLDKVEEEKSESESVSSEGNAPQLVTKLPQAHCTQHERLKLD